MDFGLCKSELKSIKIIDNQWLQCETSKERLGQDIVLRRAPFTPMARQVLPLIDFEKARTTNTWTIASTIKRYRPPTTFTNCAIHMSAAAKSSFKKETTKK